MKDRKKKVDYSYQPLLASVGGIEWRRDAQGDVETGCRVLSRS